MHILGISVENLLITLSLNIRRLSKVCRFCSRSAVPAEYKLTSSSCKTATATQKRALCKGESWPRRQVQVRKMSHKTASFKTHCSIKQSTLSFKLHMISGFSPYLDSKIQSPNFVDSSKLVSVASATANDRHYLLPTFFNLNVNSSFVSNFSYSNPPCTLSSEMTILSPDFIILPICSKT